jgi:hypothetical protein
MNVWIEENNFLTRKSCLVCGGWTEKDCAYPMAHVWDKDRFLCDRCLAAGAEGIKTELVVHASDLEEWAKDLRQLAAEPWSVPTMAELTSFRKEVDGRYMAERKADLPMGEMREIDAAEPFD